METLIALSTYQLGSSVLPTPDPKRELRLRGTRETRTGYAVYGRVPVH